MRLALGTMRVMTLPGGRELDALVPRSPTLRRASDDSKRAAIAGSLAIGELEGVPRERIGLYVAQQHGAHDACAEFIRVSHEQGPRLVSPMLFSESVANIAATHLSLALKLTGVVETLSGSRAAGLHALAAVEDDLEAGVIDAGLVVVNGMASRLLRDAYQSLYRRAKAPDLRPGAAGFCVTRKGPCRVTTARAVCFGTRERGAALRELWEGCRAERVLVSALAWEREAALSVAREVVGRDVVMHAMAESFVLDPFLQLAEDATIAPRAASRAVIVMGEEGMVGLLVVEGPVEAR